MRLVIESGQWFAGRGGNGGNGGYDVSTTLGINQTAGGTGGTAMLIDYDISIDNQNIISGGGGGGGGIGSVQGVT